MKKELFDGYDPYTNLVIAIKEDSPIISNGLYPFSTVQIARDLLLKDWKTRLTICPDKRIEEFYSMDAMEMDDVSKEIELFLSGTSEHREKFEAIEKLSRSIQEKNQQKKKISEKIEQVIEKAIEKLKSANLFKETEKSSCFYFESDSESGKTLAVRNFMYRIDGELARGFPRPLFLTVALRNDENSFATIGLLAMFLSPFIKINTSDPIQIFRQIAKEQNPFNKPNVKFESETYQAFNGTIGFDDQFVDKVALEVLKLIRIALKGVDDEVKLELERRENSLKDGYKGQGPLVVPRTKLFTRIS